MPSKEDIESATAYISKYLETEEESESARESRLYDLERICYTLLSLIGEDPDRPGLIDTPARWARFWLEFIEYDPGNTDTTFEAISVDQMVAVSGIRVWSLCEHHLLPFWCDLTIGYITADRVLGLSKFARIAHECAHKLQVQERLIKEIADQVGRLANSESVAVVGRGVHTCMVMRGIKSEGTMVSSVLRGIFMHSSAARSEFMSFANR